MATEVKIPDIGDFKDVPIIEVHVKEGDPVNADDPLVSLESDKATMEVPAPAGRHRRKAPDQDRRQGQRGHPDRAPARGRRGHDAAAVAGRAAGAEARRTAEPRLKAAGAARRRATPPAPAPAAGGAQAAASFGQAHASPSVRRLARELEVDLNKIKGTGEKGRITREDVKAFLRGPAAAPAAAAPAGGMGIPEIPAQDFSKFGPIETKPLPRIKKISGPHLHRAWLNVPHVTHHDEADITEIDAYRKELDTAAKEKGFRVTLLAFLMKASVSALRQFPEFNSSLSALRRTR